MVVGVVRLRVSGGLFLVPKGPGQLIEKQGVETHHALNFMARQGQAGLANGTNNFQGEFHSSSSFAGGMPEEMFSRDVE